MNDIRPPDGFLTWGEADNYTWAMLGMSGPPEHADRSGQPCPPHQYELAEPRVVGARPVEVERPTCCVCGASWKHFNGGKFYCKDCGR